MLDDAGFATQKERVGDVVRRWIKPLGLRWWKIDCAWVRESHRWSRDEQDGHPIAECHADWKYGEATITFDLGRIELLDDDGLDTIVVHELMHIFLNEMREGGIEHEERVATTLQKAFLWLRDELTPVIEDAKESG